jgi:PAS domain S-box-containing protein
MRKDRPEANSREAALEESETRLELALAASRLGVWEWLLGVDEIIFSARAREIYGFDPDAPLTLAMVSAATHREDYPLANAKARRALDPTVTQLAPYAYRILRPDGEVRTIVVQGKPVFEDGPDGLRPVRYVGTLDDVTEQRKLEEELQQSNETLKLAIDAARLAVWEYDLEKRHVVVTPDLKRMMGFAPDAPVDAEEINSRIVADDMAKAIAAARRSLEGGEARFEAEFRFQAPDEQVRWFMIRAQATVDDSGEVRGVTGVLMDITDRRAAEERLHLLAREVDHRANNLLAIVQGAVALSKASTVEGLKETLVGRLQALARAHQLLSESRWEAARVQRIIEEELRPYAGADTDRLTLEGADLACSAQSAQSLGMAVHELATNAAKYGALSTPTGKVEVRWRPGPDDGSLELTWEETGGDGLKPPRRRGLGLTMIERALSQTGGRAEFEWRAEGLACRMWLPLGGGRRGGPAG